MFLGAVAWLVLAALGASVADRWSWPDQQAAASVRIDSKVRFVDPPADGDERHDHRTVQADEAPRRPSGEGRSPVRAEQYRSRPINVGGHNNIGNQISDGTLDSLQYCKCVSASTCRPAADTQHACGADQHLCCYNAPSSQRHSELFNEVDDERPSLLPSDTKIEGPFPLPPRDSRRQSERGVPTDNIGVPNDQVLIGPDGPTGIIGPATVDRQPGILIGPGGSTDIRQSESAQRGVLLGPGGPTGVIGPQYNRPVLVGPGGPTGIIGPRQRGGFGSQRREVLVGPGGPTGFVGPAGFNQRRNPGVLVGPGGPTGIIGPGRQVLVGPGGPTGQVGPRGPIFGK